MAPGSRLSFEQYAQERGLTPRGTCAVCGLEPAVKAEVEKGWDLGFRGQALARFLHDSKIDGFTEPKIRNHFARGHHEHP